MSIDRHLQEKIYRLETLRKYQAYYGPNTPYQIVAEINQLEVELRRMLKADVTRPTQVRRHKPKKPARSGTPRAKSRARAAAAPKPKPQSKPKPKPKSGAKQKAKTDSGGFWGISQASTDLIATVAFIGFVFLLGAIIFAAYVQTRPSGSGQALAQGLPENEPLALRPTFTPTADPNGPPPQGEEAAVVIEGDVMLPAAEKEATAVSTAVPTLTPSPAPVNTATPTPLPTNTPAPTQPPPPPPPPPQDTPTPDAPTPVPAPQFPFTMAEQGNRMFQHTDYHVINVYIAIVSEGNIPLGGYKIIGNHSSGLYAESALSDWNWSVTNCLDCDYIKFGNVKFEPGTFDDGTWTIYVADPQGNQLSKPVPLSYSSAKEDWVWDFILFKKTF